MANFQEKLCDEWTKIANLSCKKENLVLIEKLNFEGDYQTFLKACQICGQIYLEKTFSIENGSEYNLFYKIPENRANQCHCIGFLQPVEIISEEKNCEGDAMYFSWKKETKMQCQKCGSYCRESIYQSNYDGVYFQTYTKE